MLFSRYFKNDRPQVSPSSKLDQLKARIAHLEGELTTSRREVRALRRRWLQWGEPSFLGDYLASWEKNLTFMKDARFAEAYKAGMATTGGEDRLHIEWRVAICCWAAAHGSKLDGDFVECGTNTGIMSLAICRYLDFGALPRRFFLFDTFRGLPLSQISANEQALGRVQENQMYPDCYDQVVATFRPYENVHLVRGEVPGTLDSVDIKKVAYLSIDMNIAYPERAALAHFWPRLSTGAMVILDDYGWTRYRLQKEALDGLAKGWGVEIFNLPTGQGLLVKA